MKIRLLSVVLVLLLAFPGAAFSEDYGPLENALAETSTRDLLLLKTMVEVELASREDKDMSVSVPSGIYTVGVDIPEDVYTIIGDDAVSSIKVIDYNGRTVIYETLYKEQRLGRTDLLYGFKVEITGGPVLFTRYKGLGFY